jgi:hypothetical protein
MTSYSFITFGCWNKSGDAMNNVMNKLKEYTQSEESVNRIIVTGDNYYPLKEKVTDEEGTEKKIKKVFLKKLQEGF